MKSTFSHRLWALTAAVLLGAALPVQAYTFDELPQQWTYPFVAEPPTAYLSYYQSSPNMMMTGSLHFPASWNRISAGQSVRLRVLIPPGVDWAAVGTNTPNMVGTGYACDGIVSARNEAGCTRIGMPGNHGLFPIVQGTPVPNRQARIVSMVIQAENYMGFTFGDMTITWHIADMTEYKKWRSARRWAGGSGDCDGLGNAYATGPQCDTMGTGNADPNAPTGGGTTTPGGGSAGGGTTTPGAFVVTASAQVVGGDPLVIKVANASGTIKNCTQPLDAQLKTPLNFVVSSDGAAASATAPVVTADTTLSITCVSSDDRSATPVSVKVLTAPALAVTVKDKKVTLGKMRLVLQA